MSWRTATAPPPGMGETLTSKMRPGSSEVERRTQTTRSSSAMRTHSRTSGSRMVWTSAWPTRTAPVTDDAGDELLHVLVGPLDASGLVHGDDGVLHAVDHGLELVDGSRRRWRAARST